MYAYNIDPLTPGPSVFADDLAGWLLWWEDEILSQPLLLCSSSTLTILFPPPNIKKSPPPCQDYPYMCDHLPMQKLWYLYELALEGTHCYFCCIYWPYTPAWFNVEGDSRRTWTLEGQWSQGPSRGPQSPIASSLLFTGLWKAVHTDHNFLSSTISGSVLPASNRSWLQVFRRGIY